MIKHGTGNEKRLVIIEAEMSVSLQEDKTAYRMSGRHAGRQTGRQAGRQAHRQAGRQTGIQTGRHTACS